MYVVISNAEWPMPGNIEFIFRVYYIWQQYFPFNIGV